MVFLSTIKQVRFVYEILRKMELGIPVFEYHGKQSQSKRTEVFLSFKEKRSGVLVSTNISSRGLDIP